MLHPLAGSRVVMSQIARLAMLSALAVGMGESTMMAPAKIQHKSEVLRLYSQQNLMPQTAVVKGVVKPLSTSLDLIKLQTFQSVVAGQQSVMQLPIGTTGWTYHRLWIYLTDSSNNPLTDAAIASSLINIQLLVDGDPIWNLSAAEMQMLLRHWMGAPAAITQSGTTPFAATITEGSGLGGAPLTANVGTLLMPFARSWYNGNIDAEEAAAIGTLDRKNVTLQLTWAGGSTAANGVVYAEVAPNVNLGRYIALRQFPTPVLGAGIAQIWKFLPADPAKSLCAIHFQTNLISYVSILPDGQTPLVNQVLTTVYQSMMECYRLTMRTGDDTPWTNFPIIRRWRNSDAYNLGNPNFLINPFFTSSPDASISCIAEISETKAAA